MHKDTDFAQSVMIGSILSDILFVRPRLSTCNLVLTGFLGPWLLLCRRCLADTYPRPQ